MKKDLQLERINLTVEEAAEVLGISRSQMYAQVIYRTDFPAYRLGRRIVIHYGELKEWARLQAEQSIVDRTAGVRTL